MEDSSSLESDQLQIEKDKLALEARKFELEREKLAFESRKYEAESDKRAAEVSKLKAEGAKTGLEIADLRIPFRERPAYKAQKYQMLTTAAAVVSLIVSVGTIRPALDAYFAEKSARAAEDGKQAAETKAAEAMAATREAEAKTRHAEDRLESLRAQIVPLEDQVETSTAKRIQAEHDLKFAQQRIDQLALETRRLDARRTSLEQQVGTLSRAEAYEKLQASISDSSTHLTQLLATRIQGSLNPNSPPNESPDLQKVFQALQDNVNYVALARSLLPLFEASSGSNPMEQPWKFTYSITDVRSRLTSDDVSGTLSILTMLRLLSVDEADALEKKGWSQVGYRYLQITGQLTVPFKESPLFEDGRPRSQDSFTRTYRRNLAVYIQNSQRSFQGPENTYRIKALTDDRLWQELAALGNPGAFNQAIPGISSFEATLIGSEYIFVVAASSHLAELSAAVYAAGIAVQRGDLDAYTADLNRVLSALRPFQKSDHYFENSVPWLLLVFDDMAQRRMTISAECDITGMLQRQLKRGNEQP
jgi:hypothetical protein